MRIATIILILILTASAFAQRRPSDKDRILKLEGDWVQALVSKDRKTLDRIIAPEFTFIEPDGTVKNRAEYLNDRSSENDITESFENVGLKVDVYGNAAVASAVARITLRQAGSRYHLLLRWKELWLKRDGKWQVIVSQATPVNPTWDQAFKANE